MADNLRVTAPIQTNDNISKIKSVKELPQINPLYPTKITKQLTKEQGENKTALDLLLSRDSVFAKFVEQLKQTPDLFQTLPQLIYNINENAKNLETNQATQLLYQKLSTSINMSKDDILQNLLFQQTNSSKFDGTLFKTLRDVSNQSQDNKFNLRLANFLKAYNGYFSLPSTMQAIFKNLDNIRSQIINPYSNQLHELENKLLNKQLANSVDINLSILTEEIIPFLSKYVAQTNDLGKARDNITLLMHNIARLNISSKEELVDKFESLLNYCKYNLNFSSDKLNGIKAMFANVITEQKIEGKNEFFDSLISLLSKNINQDTNLSQSLISDACNSLLLDNSVYMPYTHIFLPVIFGNRFMFSEIWVEKQDINDRQPSESDSEIPTRVFIKFDIDNLGSFEASIELLQKTVNMQLSYPDILKKENNTISTAISQVLSQNGFNAGNIVLTNGNTVSIKQQIIEKIQERKHSIDVTI